MRVCVCVLVCCVCLGGVPQKSLGGERFLVFYCGSCIKFYWVHDTSIFVGGVVVAHVYFPSPTPRIQCSLRDSKQTEDPEAYDTSNRTRDPTGRTPPRSVVVT